MEKHDDFDCIYPADKPPTIKMRQLIAYCKEHNKEIEDLTPVEGERFIIR